MLKKLICLVLSSTILLSCTFGSLAVDSSLSCSGKTVTEGMTLLSSPEEIETAFGSQSNIINPLNSESGFPQMGVTTYEYKIRIPKDSSSGTADVTFTMDVSGNLYRIFTTGDIYVLEINEEYTLLQGVLQGEININDKDYVVKIGLQKLASCNSISAGVALTPSDFDTNENANQLFFCFGTSVMTEDFIPAYLAYIGDSGEGTLGETAADIVPYSALDYVTTNVGTFQYNHFFNGSGNASILIVHRDSANKRIYLRLGSYANNIRASQFPQHHFISAGVSKISLGIERVGVDTSISSIEGVRGIMTGNNKGDKSGVLDVILEGIIKIVEQVYGLDVSLLKEIFRMSGHASYFVEGDCSEFTVSFGDSSKNFDDQATYIPVGFNIVTNGQTGYYQAYSTMEYLINTATSLLPIQTKPITTAIIKIS